MLSGESGMTKYLVNKISFSVFLLAICCFLPTIALAGLGTENSAPSAIKPQPCSLDGKACLIAPDEPKSNLFRAGWKQTDNPGQYSIGIYNNFS